MSDTLTTGAQGPTSAPAGAQTGDGLLPFDVRVSEELPPRAWLARLHGGRVQAIAGGAVRVEDGALFEGTWTGAPGLRSAACSSTVFGSGIVSAGDRLVVVAPAHTLEPVYHASTASSGLVVSNSFPALLEALDVELRDDVAYPRLFGLINRGLSHASIEIPTSGATVTVHYFENLVVGADGSLVTEQKPREPDFADFGDYRDRLVSSVASAFANAPEYRPLATLSSGYDSTASAAVARQAGCRDAVTFSSGWPWAGFSGTDDSGVRGATALGLNLRTFDRLAYLAAADAPEAEFLATGMTAEDVVYRSMEDALPRTVLVTGFWGGAAWRGNERAQLSRLDLSGTSLGELRLRTDFIHLPLPFVAGLSQPSLRRIRGSAEMKPFSVGGKYDEPIARRLAEEEGVPRGSFAVSKMATSVLFHSAGLAALSESGRSSFEAFCSDVAPGILERLPRRRPIGRRGRIALRTAHALRADRLTASIAQRRLESVHIEPVLGSLLLRWSVALVRQRYRSLRGFGLDLAQRGAPSV